MSLVNKDKWNRDWNELLQLQADQLMQLETVLKPEVFADLKAWCDSTNRQLTDDEVRAREGLYRYTRGGLHICAVGQELFHHLQKYGIGASFLCRQFREGAFRADPRKQKRQ